MNSTPTLRSPLLWLAATCMLFAAPISAAAIDTFTVYHYSGPCSSVPFEFGHKGWSNRSRISIRKGEGISIRLYGHFADLATDAVGSDIWEWIERRGTTTDYPDVQLSMGQRVPKGYVDIAIKSASEHGTGNHTVKVLWVGGSETIQLKVVSSCNALKGSNYRPDPDRNTTSAGSSGTAGLTSSNPAVPNLMPYVFTPYVLVRPVGDSVLTGDRRMTPLDSRLCTGLPPNEVTSVPVPKFTWGVIGTNIELANTQFEVKLFDVTDSTLPRVLDTLVLPNGFPANTPLVHRDNYPGRPTSIRVIFNPSFGSQSFAGCFTAPGTNPPMDPQVLVIGVDPNGNINEGDRENDNEYRVP